MMMLSSFGAQPVTPDRVYRTLGAELGGMVGSMVGSGAAFALLGPLCQSLGLSGAGGFFVLLFLLPPWLLLWCGGLGLGALLIGRSIGTQSDRLVAPDDSSPDAERRRQLARRLNIWMLGRGVFVLLLIVFLVVGFLATAG